MRSACGSQLVLWLPEYNSQTEIRNITVHDNCANISNTQPVVGGKKLTLICLFVKNFDKTVIYKETNCTVKDFAKVAAVNSDTCSLSFSLSLPTVNIL